MKLESHHFAPAPNYLFLLLSLKLLLSGAATEAAAVAAAHKADAPGKGAAVQRCGLQKNGEFGQTAGDDEEGELLRVLNMTL